MSTIQFQIGETSSNFYYTGIDGYGIYIQDAQLEQGLVATDYIETTSSSVAVGITNDIPRINYEGGIGNFLLEPSRTNSVVHSEYFGGWSLINVAVTSNSIISPDGTLNGSKLIASSGASNKVIFQAITANTYTASVFAKKGEFEGLILATGTTGAFFNLNTHSYRTNYTSAPTSYKIEDYGNGWYRVSFNYTSHSSISLAQYSVYINGSTASGNTFYTFGGQIEKGSYLTSYMKTEASTVTRLKDECLNGGDSDLFDITVGTFFVDATPFIPNSNNKISLSDESSNNRIELQFRADANGVDFLCEGQGNGLQVNRNESITYNSRNKLLVTFDDSNFKIYVNGVLEFTDTSFTKPIDLDNLKYTAFNSILNFEGKIHDTRVYDRVLTEAEAIELTT